MARLRVLSLALLVGAAPVASGIAAGQDGSPGARIRVLAARGDSGAARRIADSVVSSGDATGAALAEGYYWRGALASSARDRRLNFVRVAVEYPSSPFAGDALYGIALLDLASGNREGARRQLERAFRDHGASATSGDAAFEFGQILIADGNARDGCAALDSAIQRTPQAQVEKRNRMAYARRTCAQLVAEPPPDSQPAASTGPGGARGDSAGERGRGTTRGRGAAPVREWSAQVGAFASKEDADRVMLRLPSRGYEARVTGDSPFRVRVGRFPTRAAATALIAKLKRERTTAILVEAERR
jgi:cell division septation protein DedD